eukprot:1060469-Amphidinium_carterae.1
MRAQPWSSAITLTIRTSCFQEKLFVLLLSISDFTTLVRISSDSLPSRQLFPASSQNARAVMHARSRLAKLTRKNPLKISGRHAFTSEYFRKAAHLNKDRGTAAEKITQHKVISWHAKHWGRLSDEKRAKYNRDAAGMVSDRLASLREEREEASRHLQEAILEESPKRACQQEICHP